MGVEVKYPWIEQRRAVKADKIAAALRAAHIDPQQAVRLTVADRRAIEAAAAVTRPGSAATWRNAVEMVAGSRRERALCLTCKTGDPQGPAGPPKSHGHAGRCTR